MSQSSQTCLAQANLCYSSSAKNNATVGHFNICEHVIWMIIWLKDWFNEWLNYWTSERMNEW